MQRKDDVTCQRLQLSFSRVGRGEQLGVGFGLPQEWDCNHTLGTGAKLVTNTTLVVHQPLNVPSRVAGKGCYQAGVRIRGPLMEELVCSNKNSIFIMS